MTISLDKPIAVKLNYEIITLGMRILQTINFVQSTIIYLSIWIIVYLCIGDCMTDFMWSKSLIKYEIVLSNRNIEEVWIEIKLDFFFSKIYIELIALFCCKMKALYGVLYHWKWGEWRHFIDFMIWQRGKT